MKDKLKILSTEEIQIILNRRFGSGTKLVDFQIRPLSEGAIEGFLGEHFIVDITYDDGKKCSCFGKVPPWEHELMLGFTRMSTAFEKETFFYETLIKEFKERCKDFDSNFVPDFYYSRGNELVVMENLLDRGYVVANCGEIMGVDHIQTVLRSMAKLHSSSIMYEECMSKTAHYRLIDHHEDLLKEAFFRPDEKYLGYMWHIASLKGVIALIDKMPLTEIKIGRDNFKKKFTEAANKCFDLVKPSKRFRNAVCHGDMWKKNVMFKYDSDGSPVDCCIVDFQLQKYCPPAFDVLKFIHQTTSAEIRYKHYDALLNYYHKNLVRELKKLGGSEDLLSLDEFLVSCARLLPQCKIETAYYFTYQKPGFDYLEQLMKDDEGFKDFSFGDRSSYIAPLYVEGSNFKRWMDEILFEIRDMVSNEGFTREDCHTILKSSFGPNNNVKLIKYELCHPDSGAMGFLCEHRKLKMSITKNGVMHKLKMFVKRLSDTGFTSFTVESGAFENERYVYQQVFGKDIGYDRGVSEFAPRFFLARVNDIVVLEDLREQDFKNVERRAPLDVDHLRVCLRTLAKQHAAMLTYIEKPEERYKNHIKEVTHTYDGLPAQAVKAVYKGLESNIDLFPLDLSCLDEKELIKKIHKLFKQTIELIKPSKTYRNVVCHGDLWNTNLLFKYDAGKPVDCRLVDYQCVRLSPPAADFMELLHLTTTRQQRIEFETELKLEYHRQLTKALISLDQQINDILPLDTFLESCDVYRPFAVTHACYLLSVIMTSDEETKKLFSDKDYCHREVFVDRSELIRKQYIKDPYYKRVMDDCMKDLQEVCSKL